MAKAKRIVATAGDIARQFSHYSDVALQEPVIVTKNGRPRNVLISVSEYERLKRRNQEAFFVSDIPERFLPQIEALARGKAR